MRGFKNIIGAILVGASFGLLLFSGFVYLLNSDKIPHQVRDDTGGVRDDPTLPWLRGAGIRAYVVLSGSMEPALKTGSLVFTKSADSYSPHEIITFKTGKGGLVTHRIVSVSPIDGGVEYFTKGDANEEADSSPIPHSAVVGRATHSVPYLGYFANFVKTPYGFVVLVVIPSSIIIWEELKVLFGEAKGKLKKVKIPDLLRLRRIVRDDTEATVRDDHGRGFSKLAVLVPGLTSLFLVVAVSGAYFSDIENSMGNVFGAADDFTTGKVVINEVYYDPDEEHMQGGLPENSFEWVELYNGSTSVVNLKNWKVTDNSGTERSISTSNRDLNPGEFVVLAKAANTRVLWGIPENKFISIGENIGNGLANGGDKVILKDDSGNLIDQVGYENNHDIWNPAVPNVADGHSIERNPAGFDNDLASDFVDKELPTPGS